VPAHAQQPAASAAPVKLGIVSFLTGPAASPFGIPGRNGAEIVIEAFNAGKAPAPFNQVGLGGAKIEAKYVDEAGTVQNVVTEFRNLVQRDQVDAVVGYVSSGSCLAVTPVAEELKALTVFYDCGTPRIFEEKARSYVFRVSRMPPWTASGCSATCSPRKESHRFSGINQNYAWGGPRRDFRSHEGSGAEGRGGQGALSGSCLSRIRRGGVHAFDFKSQALHTSFMTATSKPSSIRSRPAASTSA
jgi:branched-chain amino acid transport system substrate-binding protein